MTKPFTHADLHRTTKIADIHVGEVWAYRASSTSPLERVTVESISTGGIVAPRLSLRFDSDKVISSPARRLKVLWENKGSYEMTVDRWAAVEAAAPRSATTIAAADALITALIHRDMAQTSIIHPSALLIDDLPALLIATGIDPSELSASPVAFVEEGVTVAAWPDTLLVAQHLAQLRPDTAHAEASELEADAAWWKEDDPASEFAHELSATAKQLRGWAREHPAKPVSTADTTLLRRDLEEAKSIAAAALDLLKASGVTQVWYTAHATPIESRLNALD